MLNPRFEVSKSHAFRRLGALLQDVTPKSNQKPVLFSVGEPQNQPPPLLAETLARHADQWNRYPPQGGTPEFKQAAAGWLNRRYALPAGMIEPERHILPMPGSREPLFMAALIAVAPERRGKRPVVLIPNPAYHVYAGAAALAGADAVFLPATKETGFLPNLDRIPAEVLDRTALFYLCTPANPQGVAADLAYLKQAIQLARTHEFVLVVDECYAEIYDRTQPVGILQAAAALGGDLKNIAATHSLSKRSSAPGLRSGFVVAHPDLIKGFSDMIGYAGAGVPVPTLAASVALWSDDAHVEANRTLYRANFDAAERLFAGRLGFYRPDGGFYLWLDVGDGETAAKRLWAEAAIRTLPGGYMGPIESNGTHPGKPYIRVALVYDTPITAAALARMAEVL
ncbi:MAG: aminotransferase class I/II-fold pyridoxal phosphate-dependent enzyme [Proteobacteria bacterium]|nr:aminotransferase class I/II-fold pyridoxal phosphate-dependent enzyme [Pseudomonadota bacterium]MBI3499718.1 aminotransferase class I/II-fold pyridoxal phosphate-dependent enzyme [Pseudomonadota bacterium]